MSDKIYIDASTKSLNKVNEELCGDRVEMMWNKDDFFMVLSDGLGSGVKANILATLTSKIISTMIKAGANIEDTVDTIVHTLPVCKVRDLAYSTFSILQVSYDGKAYLVEFDNPSCIYVKKNRVVPLNYKTREIAGKCIRESRFTVEKGDVITLISDGVVYAGIGQLLNLGWNWDNVAEYVKKMTKTLNSSARLTETLSDACDVLYMNKPGDDTTVATVRITSQQTVSIFSGPPIDPKDDELAIRSFMEPEGKKIICGGSSANIVSRILGEPIETDINYTNFDIPPIGKIKGIDLVTEGVLTLCRAVETLEYYYKNPTDKSSIKLIDEDQGAAMLAKILIEECTHLNFFIGKKINPAHQNPNLPVDLSIKLRILEDLYNIMLNSGKIINRVFY